MTKPKQDTKWRREQILGSLADMKERFSPQQFDSHWLEWVDQALSSQQQELLEALNGQYLGSDLEKFLSAHYETSLWTKFIDQARGKIGLQIKN